MTSPRGFNVPSLAVYDSQSSVSSDEYEWDCNQILDGLYLGSLGAAVDQYALSTAQVTCMITLLKQSELLHLQDMNIVGTVIPESNWLYLDIEDQLRTDIFTQFDTTNRFIEKHLAAKENVLVHCLAGISRSTTIVCAYLMYSHSMSLEGALQLCQSKRRQAGPNFAFLEQLQRYEIFLREQRSSSDNDNTNNNNNSNNNNSNLPTTTTSSSSPSSPLHHPISPSEDVVVVVSINNDGDEEDIRQEDEDNESRPSRGEDDEDEEGPRDGIDATRRENNNTNEEEQQYHHHHDPQMQKGKNGFVFVTPPSLDTNNLDVEIVEVIQTVSSSPSAHSVSKGKRNRKGVRVDDREVSSSAIAEEDEHKEKPPLTDCSEAVCNVPGCVVL